MGTGRVGTSNQALLARVPTAPSLGDRRLTLTGVALTLHLLVALPAAALPTQSDHAVSTIRIVTDAIVAALLLLAVGLARSRPDDLQPTLVDPREMENRYAERDHELRNGLAGLAGVTKLLESSPRAEDRALLHSVTAELSRLDAMLEDVTPFPAGEPAPAATYAVEPILRSQIVLWRSTGMDIRLDTDSDLWAAGGSAALTQVVSNLLSNCARHAPGSPVRIQATQRRDRIRILISDLGPGIPPGREERAFDRGTCDPVAGGDGLGLHISRRLLAVEGGSLSSAPSAPGRGATLVVDLPAARESAARAR